MRGLSPNTGNQGGAPNTGPQPTIGRTSGTATSGLASSEAYGSNQSIRSAKDSQEKNALARNNPLARPSKFGPNVS